MTITTYKVTMNVVKEMTVTIDSDKINEEFFSNFSSYMFKCESNEAICEHIGHNIMYNDDDFVEGVGELKWHTPDISGIGIAVSRVVCIEEEFETEELK